MQPRRKRDHTERCVGYVCFLIEDSRLEVQIVRHAKSLGPATFQSLSINPTGKRNAVFRWQVKNYDP